MKRIGVMTSGGDAPGMNPAIRAVVRTALSRKVEVAGIRRGYRGLFENDVFPMTSRHVSGIISEGGTILRSIRFPGFADRAVRETCAGVLRKNGVEGLVVIGGDGSSRAAHLLATEFSVPVAVIPASIDNDVYGTDLTVGFDTAVNTAVEAIDRIRDTATSHQRIFIIEVMGREKGNLAVEVALASGAEIVMIPEIPVPWESVVASMEENVRRGKVSAIIVLAEGAGRAPDVAARLQESFPDGDIRYSVLGYIQRGGRPSSFTRVLATRFGVEAVSMLLDGEPAGLVGLCCGRMSRTPLAETVSHEKPVDPGHLEIIRMMSV